MDQCSGSYWTNNEIALITGVARERKIYSRITLTVTWLNR